MIKFLMRALFVFFVLTNTLQIYAQTFRVDVNETISTSSSHDNMLSRTINIPTATTQEAWIVVKSNISAESELIYVYINGNRIDRLAGDGGGSSYIALKLMPWQLKEGDNVIKIVVNNIFSEAEIQWIQILQDPQDTSGGRYLTEHRFYSSYYEDNLFVNYFKLKCLTELAGKTPGANTLCVNMGYIEGSIGYRMKEKDISYNVATSTLSDFKLAEDWGQSTKYYLTGILMDASENVLDVREYDFNYDNTDGPDPFGMRFVQNSYCLTNSPVEISVSDFYNFDGRTVTNFELPDGSIVNDANDLVYSASDNGTYTFKVVSGGSTYSFTHTVSNIDKTAPVISLLGENPFSVLEGTTYSEPGYSVSDNVSSPESSDVVSNTINTDDVSTQIITYSLTDDAGNTGTATRTINITAQPLTVVTNAENQSLPNVTFNGTLQYLGSSSITGHGFVWGMLEYPSLDFCLASNDLGVKTTKGDFNHSVSSFEQGETYYVRAYATNANGETVYGAQKQIVYVGANYGSIQIENPSYSVSRTAGSLNMNIDRTGGSDGAVSCSYIIYDGSALSGTHYTSSSGELSFAEGETQKTISIPITNNTGDIGDRQFYIQLYDAEGGAALGTNTFSTVTIDYNPVNTSIVQYQPNSANNNTLIYNAFGPDAYGDGVSCRTGWSSSGGDFEEGCNANFQTDAASTTVTSLTTNIGDYLWNSDLRINATVWSSLNSGNDEVTNRLQYTTNSGASYTTPYSQSHDDNSGIRTLVSGGIVPTNVTGIRFQHYRDKNGLAGEKSKFNEVRVTLWDNIAPSFSSITAGSRTYKLGQYIYFSVKFREQVYVTGTPRLQLDLNGTTKYADYYSGSGCDVLVFRYQVASGDDCRTTDVNSTTISLNGGTIKDLYGNDSELTTTSQSLNQTSDVYIDGRVPTITFAANTSRTTWKTNHSQLVTLTNASSKKYVWAQQTTTPQQGWQSFTEDSKTFNIKGVTDNDWYLHIFAAHSNGNTLSSYVGPFYLDNTVPEITLSPSSVDAWTNNNVNISVTGSDSHSGVSSITSTPSLSSSGTNPKSFTVIQNGTYTFSVTDNVGLVSDQSITIDKIETELPVISASQTSSDGNWVTSGSTTISIEDMPADVTLQSGIATSQYCWTSSSSSPSSGWQNLPELTGGTIKDEAGITGDRYFHIKCTDNAGNIAYLNSGIFKTVNNTPPTLSISTNISPTVWTKDPIVATVTGAAQVTGLNLARVSLPTYTNDDGIVISEQTNIDLNQGTVSETFNIDRSGYYEVTLYDEAGNSAQEILTIDKIDTDAPSINVSNSSNGEWTNQPVTISATVTDNVTAMYDADGNFTGNSGSGLNTATVTSNGNTVDFSSGFSTSVTSSPTTFTFYALDNVGNTTTYQFEVNNIDTNNPTVTTTNNNYNWQTSNFEVPLTFADSESGIVLKEYAVTTTETTPGSYTTYSSPISFATEGTFYLHYKAVDFAGNEKTGSFGPYKLDITDPEVTTTNNNYSWQKNNISVPLTFSDTESGMNKEQYSLSLTTSPGTLSDYSEPISISTEGIYYVHYRGEDNAGKIQSGYFGPYKLDKTPPTISTTNNDYTWQTSNFLAPLTFTDERAGITEKLYSLSETTTPGTYSTYNSAVSVSTGGEYYLHYKAVDAAGNETTGYFGPYKLDKTGPTSVGFSYDMTYYDPRIIGWMGADPESGLHDTERYQFAVDGVYGEWGTERIKSMTGLGYNKAYRFKIRVKNNAGLTTEATEITRYTRALAPSAEIATSSGTQLTFALTHNSENDELAECSYTLKNSEGEDAGTIDWTTETSITFSGLTAGDSYNLYATPRNADNVAKYTYTIYSNAITNRPPVATNESYTVYKNHVLTVNGSGILANDTDPDGNSLTAVLKTGSTAEQGTLSLSSTGSFSFIPATGFTGDVIFTYNANDGYENSDDVGTVTISVVIPTWNGTGAHTTAANWNGNEIPGESDEVLIQSGTMTVSSDVTFDKMTINEAQVLVESGSTLTLGECDYSGDVLQASNGGTIIINGNIYSGSATKLEVKSSIRTKSGIKF